MCKKVAMAFKGLFPLFSIRWSELTNRDQPHRDEHRLIGSESLPFVDPHFLFHSHFHVLPIMLLKLQVNLANSSSRRDMLLVFLRDGMRLFRDLSDRVTAYPEHFLRLCPECTLFSEWSHEVATTAVGNRPKVSFTTAFQSVFTSPDSLPCLKRPQDSLEIGGPNETVTSCYLLTLCDIRRYRKWILRSPEQPFGMHNDI
jgi:hypothetical protein